MSITSNAYSFSTVKDPIIAVMRARLPVLLRGETGIGKSEFVRSLSAQLDELEGIKRVFIDRRVSQMTEGDAIGLPKVEGNSTSWNLPDWLKQACNEPCTLFLDEVMRGVREVRQSFFELGDSRKIWGNKLHADTIVIAADNSGENDTSYQVYQPDPAELSRWGVFDVSPTPQEWISWARENGVNPLVYDFIAANSQHLEHSGEYQPNRVYPNRRSWTRLSKVLSGARWIETRKDAKENSKKVRVLAQGFVGFEAAGRFSHYLEHVKSFSVDDVLEGKWEEMKDISLAEHNEIISYLFGHPALKKKMSDVHCQNLLGYLSVLPDELIIHVYDKLMGCQVAAVAKMKNMNISGVQLSDILKRVGGKPLTSSTTLAN